MATEPTYIRANSPHRNGPAEQTGRPVGPLVLAGLLLGIGYLLRILTRRPAPPQELATKGPDRPSLRNGHELRDASIGWIFGVVAILAAGAVAMHFLLAGMLGWLNKKPAPGDQWQPVARSAGGLVAPVATYPKLQLSPPLDLEKFRAREDARLNSYGWISQTSGIVHIPISVAMDLILKKGLPLREEGNQLGPSSYDLQIQRVEQQPQQQEVPR